MTKIKSIRWIQIIVLCVVLPLFIFDVIPNKYIIPVLILGVTLEGIFILSGDEHIPQANRITSIGLILSVVILAIMYWYIKSR